MVNRTSTISDEELGRRLAAARAYRGMYAKDVEEAAKAKGFVRGFGNSMLSLTETANHKKGTDHRSVRVLCEIYDFPYEVIVDPSTKLFSASTPGIIEQMRSQLDDLAAVVSDVSVQVQTGLFERDRRLAAEASSDQQGHPAEPLADS